MKFKIYFFVAVYAFLLPSTSGAEYKAVFTPGISITGEYTDNVNLSDDNEESDYITTISPEFDLEISKKNRGIIISYEPGYSIYEKNASYNTWRQSAQFLGWADISKRTKIEFNDSLDYSEEPISEEDTTVRKGREPYFTNSAGINLSHQPGKSDFISMGYVYSILENKDQDIEDNAKHNPSMTYSHKFNPYLSLDTDVSYIRGEFEVSDDFDNWDVSLALTRKFTKYLDGSIRYSNTIMDYKGDSEDYIIYDSSIGMNYIIAEDTLFSLNAGYFIQDREKSDDESGLTIDGNLGKTWRFKRGSVNITGASGYDESYFGAESLGFDIFYQAEGTATYAFTRYLSGNIDGSYRSDTYVNLDPERTDRTKNAGLGLTFRSPIRWLPVSIELSYLYYSVDSSLSENDYEDQRVQVDVSISKTFSKPIRLN
ncbi:MAG: outer membrane beta-barrel protein [Deltaproteobacteria bacterium]|nr:outer membrane beta-barrel protein [Deltaproteobacteria bacterium]